MAESEIIDDGFAGAESALDPPPPQEDTPTPQTKSVTQDEPPPPQAEEPSSPTVEPVDPSPLTLEEAPPTQSDPSPPPPVQPQPKPKPSPPKTAAAPVTTTSQGKPPAAKAQPPAAKAQPPDGPQDRKAREFIDQAEKKLKSSQSFFGGLFGGTAKKEEAADLFVRAANAYKVGKRYKAAGEAFRRAAEIHVELDVKHEAASTLVEAGQVLKKDDALEATECYLKAVEIYTDMGRFSLAARYHNTVAEIFETEVRDYDQAITHYEQASDFFKGEDAISSSNKALLKVAHMCATLQQYKKAADLFEEIGINSLTNTLLKYAAKDYFFKACLCQFCISPGNARDATIRYRQLHPGFEGSRELKLITDLLAAVDDEDTDKFGIIVTDYDAISRLDNWTSGLLLTIKKAVNAVPDVN